MSGKETKMGGETSQGNEDVPQPASAAVRKPTGQISGGSHEVLDEADPIPARAEAPWNVRKSCATVDIICSSSSSCVTDITQEEVKSYTSSSAVRDRMKSLDDALVKRPCQLKIGRIPFILSDNLYFKKYFKPMVVSVGPYHHEVQNLNMIERFKPKIAMLFIQKHDLCKEIIYSKIRKEIEVLKEFYEKDALDPFKDDDLAWMFFLDGCIVLHYIYCATYYCNYDDEDEFQKWDIKPDCLIFVKHDLFLLENQLPYRVLKLVISCLNDRETIRKSIGDFIIDSIEAQWGSNEKLNFKACRNEAPKHLLDLLRTNILQSDVKITKSYSIIQHLLEPLEKIKDLVEYIGKALENFPRKQTEDCLFHRNAEQLKAAGIRLKPKNTGCLTDINFNHGTLKIHSIIVDDSTASLFLNLIAYEMTPDFPNDLGISSYEAFLASLIDRAQDVKELRDKQILHNFLSSDEEVVKLFNEISTNLVSNPKKYLDVKRKIQKRYKNAWMTGIAQLMHQLVQQYFQTPWSAIAFLAAAAALALTAIQTVYTVKCSNK